MNLAADALSGLNADQLRSISHRGGPLLVVAGPGSGKTLVITSRIAHLVIDSAIPAEKILAITFTRRAAQEMKLRLATMLPDAGRVRVGTFHWLCHAILRRQSEAIGHPKGFRVLAAHESAAIIRGVCRERPLGEADGGRSVAAISACKNGLGTIEAARRFHLSPHALTVLLETYRAQLDRIGALDLDDLQSRTVELLQARSDLRERYQHLFHEILVDEYQDTNPVQQELLVQLRSAPIRLMAVGDEDQAIYGWRQATAGTVRQFELRFPGATTIVLHDTYRCTKRILRLSGKLIERNTSRREKVLRSAKAAGDLPTCYRAVDERDEAAWVAARIARLVGAGKAAWEEVAVLFRVNAQSRALEEALIQAGIPFRVHSGHRFFRRPDVRAALALLRLTLDENDVDSLAYLAGCVPGVGDRRVAALRSASESLEVSLLECLTREHSFLPARTRADFVHLHDRVLDIRSVRTSRLDRVVDRSIQAVRDLFPHFFAAGTVAGVDALDELRSLVSESRGTRATLREFVNTVDQSMGDVEEQGVSLLSLHAAKGLEFPVVFLVGLEEGLLPHLLSQERGTDVEEERRLCYVGVTRASRYLHLSYARERLLGGQRFNAAPSRFLAEMGTSNMKLEISTSTKHQGPPGRRIPGRSTHVSTG